MGEKQDGIADMLMPPTDQGISNEIDLKVQKYLRGEGANLEVLQDKKLRGQLAVREKLYGKSAKVAAKVEKFLMPSEGGYLEVEGIEKTWRIKQESIASEVGILSRRNLYDIILPALGPYTMDFTASGQYMTLAGRKGHLAILDMQNVNLIKEFQVRETVRDVVFLHNELFFAAAQEKYPYIYSRDGPESHCLKEHEEVLRLQFLKNHFLLASVNKFGRLRYQDVTTGSIVIGFRICSSSDVTNVMQVNPYNGVVATGHSGGTVAMWKPTSSAPLYKRLCHQSSISALAFHPNGHLMATSGTERNIKLWDLRKYDKELQALRGHANTLDFSQKGLLACGTGSYVQVLGEKELSGNKKSSGFMSHSVVKGYERFMSHSMVKGYQIGKVLFRPYEDVMCIGHSMGFSSLLIPGSGEPNFDSGVANPFETSKQRREKEVRTLLDKLPPETIMLDPSKLGTLKPPLKERKAKEEREAEMVAAAIDAVKAISMMKKKTKGRNRPTKMMKKKRELVAKAKRLFLKQQIDEKGLLSIKNQKINEQVKLPHTLQRFQRKTAAK